MSLWNWALAAYAKPDVEAACLDLQDSHRQCVPYLLWAAWAAKAGRPLDEETLKAGATLALRWERAAVAPLRQARRGLKLGLDGIPDTAREQLRAKVKAMELQAESVMMQALEPLAPAPGPAALPVRPALAAASAAWTQAAPDAALRRLAQALG
jgi:uncharacterized protein (TIGR02444 family)